MSLLLILPHYLSSYINFIGLKILKLHFNVEVKFMLIIIRFKLYKSSTIDYIIDYSIINVNTFIICTKINF